MTKVRLALSPRRSRSRAIHPIIGARTVEQLTDNLGTLDCDLPSDAARKLADATGYSPTFPTNFIDQTSSWVFGEAAQHIHGRP